MLFDCELAMCVGASVCPLCQHHVRARLHCAAGVSGAGRSAKQNLIYCEVSWIAGQTPHEINTRRGTATREMIWPGCSSQGSASAALLLLPGGLTKTCVVISHEIR